MLRARVDAMKASRPGRTRTADAYPPPNFWRRGNYLPYVAFGSCGLLLIAVGFGILRLVWLLGDGDPAAWRAAFEAYAHPAYLVFHAFALIALTWFAFRFFRLFPKTQPPKIGPFARPPDAVFLFGFGAAFAVATLLVALVLGGGAPVRTLMLRLEPVIWMLFGAGMMVGALLYPAFLLVATIAAPLGVISPDALSYERAYALASHPIGRVVLAAAIAFPLWAGAHHVRHVAIDFGQIAHDAWFGALCYALALAGSVLAIVAVVRL